MTVVYSIMNQYQIDFVKNELTVTDEKLKFSGSDSGCVFGVSDDIFDGVKVYFSRSSGYLADQLKK